MGLAIRTASSSWEPRAGLSPARLATVVTGAVSLGCLLFVLSPQLESLLGSERRPAADGASSSAALQRRVDATSRAVVSRMDLLRSDIALIGATNAVSTFLRTRELTARLAVSHDLSAFVAAKPWCRRIELVSNGGALVTAVRDPEGPACERLAEIATAVSSGLFLLDQGRRDSRSRGTLCLAASVEPAGGPGAAIVAEADTSLVFTGLAGSAASGEAGPFVRDGGGNWVIRPAAAVGHLVSGTAALSSWQGPAGGRWEVAFSPAGATPGNP